MSRASLSLRAAETLLPTCFVGQNACLTGYVRTYVLKVCFACRINTATPVQHACVC